MAQMIAVGKGEGGRGEKPVCELAGDKVTV